MASAEREGAYRGGRPLSNRLSLCEGIQALDCQRLGRAAEGLQFALLNSTPPALAAEPTIRLLAAWPVEQDATLPCARGGFVTTAKQKNGRVEFVEILSEAGVRRRLHNPWGEGEVTLVRDGAEPMRVSDAQLTFLTRVDERLRLTRG